MDGGMVNGLNRSLESSLENELETIIRRQQRRIVSYGETYMNVNRSGSAPPTIEGSLNVVGSLFRNPNLVKTDSNSSSTNGVLTEEEVLSHPSYLSYYYSNENVNPRLTPPLLSKEDWQVAQRFQALESPLGGLGDWRKMNVIDEGNSSSLFSMQPALAVRKSAEDELMELRKVASATNLSRIGSVERLDGGSNGSIGALGFGMGMRRKSFADILQEGLHQPPPSLKRLSCPASCVAFSDVDTGGICCSHSGDLCNGSELHSGAATLDRSSFLNRDSSVPHSFASVMSPSAVPRSAAPEFHLMGRSSNPCVSPIGSRVLPIEKRGTVGKEALNDRSVSTAQPADLAASLSGFNLSKGQFHEESQLCTRFDKQANNIHVDVANGLPQNFQEYFIDKLRMDELEYSAKHFDFDRDDVNGSELNVSKLCFDGHVSFPRRTSSSGDLCSIRGSKLHLQAESSPASTLGASGNGLNFRRTKNHSMSNLHMPVTDLFHAQNMLKASDYGIHVVAESGGLPQGTSNLVNTVGHGDLKDLQKAYLESLITQKNQGYETQHLNKPGSLYLHSYRKSSFGLGMPHQGTPTAISVLPSLGSRTLSQNEQMTRFSSTMKSAFLGSMGLQNSENGAKIDGRFALSLLEEVKNNKTKPFELSDVIGHVVEFSTHQYGSRFIQRKLETATVEESKMIFPEIIPHARCLMTDVFGNYVIQKFFEHGNETQRKELASQLLGHVLPLSLQMYGCRVIQKALEVVDVDLQTQMVSELDGSVMKCVRDQNGNHVIQKCIEFVPQSRIQFIVSAFFGQVVPLSSHPYGCRVIQRVLEHCHDPNTQDAVMGEIMSSVCTLAQDQYGNYVIQHVLQHGKRHERSAIIRKLVGQIVTMSRQKFASNVVEKCLTFGSPEERQLLVNEMLGSTDENEPLQAMMKDPFGNYVVQKVLETCDERSRELILSRIKVHLAALKRYTYGKHIVSRVEKLITSGERRVLVSPLRSP